MLTVWRQRLMQEAAKSEQEAGKISARLSLIGGTYAALKQKPAEASQLAAIYGLVGEVYLDNDPTEPSDLDNLRECFLITYEGMRQRMRSLRKGAQENRKSARAIKKLCRR